MVDIVAHRGLHARARENTVEAFEAAVALGVQGVELDVRRTLDGALVVHHDATIGDLVIASSERRRLPDYVPTLEDAVASLRGVRVNVEIKNIQDRSEPSYDPTGAFASEVVALLVNGGWSSSAMISCFDLATCEAVANLASGLAVGWLLWDVDVDYALARAKALGLDAVHPHFLALTPGVVERAHEMGVAVNVWTVNEARDLVATAALGVDSIITDEPALALELLA